MENTGIQWCDHTYNPWIGCTKVSAGCDNCYAERDSGRFAMAEWGPGAKRVRTKTTPPLRWHRKNLAGGTRESVFCASMADVFDTEAPEEWRDDLLALIRTTTELDWLLLTKRPIVARARASHWFVDHRAAWPYPPNASFGVSAEDGATLAARWPYIADFPTMRFLSLEPLLAGDIVYQLEALEYSSKPLPDWIIVGGESGPHWRPFPVDHARWIRDWCQERSIPFFFKQMAGPRPNDADVPADLRIRQYPRFKGVRLDALTAA